MTTRETTADDFLAFVAQYDDRRFELIDGAIVEMSPSEEHGLVATNIAAMLWNFVRPRKLGRVHTEVMHSTDDKNVRVPDVSFTSKARAAPVVRSGAVPSMPDLAVEVKSPRNSLESLRDKAAYYLTNGARLVWIVDPVTQTVEVHTPDSGVQALTDGDTLTGGALLPGFRVPVADLFEVE